jgi:hypothetical protein
MLSAQIKFSLPKSVIVLHLGKKYEASVINQRGRTIDLFIWLLDLKVETDIIHIINRDGGVVI